MPYSPESYVPFGLDKSDITTPKKFLKIIQPAIEVVTKTSKKHETDLIQNEIHITNKKSKDRYQPGQVDYSLRMNRNGIAAKNYDYNIGISTRLDNSSIKIDVGEIIPVKDGTPKITDAVIAINKGEPGTKSLSIQLIGNSKVPIIKETYRQISPEILDAAFDAIIETGKSLNQGEYDLSLEPREGGMDGFEGLEDTSLRPTS